MTFEELIRQDLMNTLHVSHPAITLDSKGEPETARVIFPSRSFDDSNFRRYAGETSNDPEEPMTLDVFTVSADVATTAEFQIYSKEQMDLEALFAALLSTKSVIWTWQGQLVRVDRKLKTTKLADVKPCVRESVFVKYSAPYLKSEQVLVVPDSSWFDGWEFVLNPEE